MRTLRNRSRTPQINITPLVDVLLILLVVLLLAMPLYVKRLPVDLPQTSLAGAPTPVNAIGVSIQPGGTYTLQGTPASLTSIENAVSSAAAVELSVDKGVTYDVIAQTISRIQKKNPKEIVLLTR